MSQYNSFITILSEGESKCVHTTNMIEKGHEVSITLSLNTKEEIIQPAYVDIYLSTSPDSYKEEDIIMTNIPLGLIEYSPELSEIIVGPGESVHVKLKSGTNSKVSVVMNSTLFTSEKLSKVGKIFSGTITVDDDYSRKEFTFHNTDLTSDLVFGTLSVTGENGVVVEVYLTKPDEELHWMENMIGRFVFLEEKETVFGYDLSVPYNNIVTIRIDNGLFKGETTIHYTFNGRSYLNV